MTKRVIKFDSLANSVSAAEQATDNANTATTNASNAATVASEAAGQALATAGVDPNYISYTTGALPDSSGAAVDTIGAYYTDSGLLQKVQWDGSAWQEIGEAVAVRQYVDDKASLLAYDLIQVYDNDGESLVTSRRPNRHPANIQPPASFCFIIDNHNREIIDNNGRGGGFPSGGMKEVFDALNIKANISIFNDWFGGANMTEPELLSVQDDGWELMSHLRGGGVEGTNAAAENSDDEETAIQKVKDRKEFHISKGFNVKSAVYLGGSPRVPYISAVRTQYRSASIVGGDRPNVDAINTYSLGRQSMDALKYNEWISLVDKTIEENGMMIFYVHLYVDQLYDEPRDDDGNPNAGGDFGWEKIRRLVEYIQAQAGYSEEIQIQPIDKALDWHGNILDVGVSSPDFSGGPFTRISKKGNLSSSTIDNWNERTKYITTEETHNYYGFRAGDDATNNTSLSAFGHRSAEENSGGNSSFFGHLSGFQNQGGDSSGFGVNAGFQATGEGSSYVGVNSGRENSGAAGSFLGEEAGRGNGGSSCAFVGRRAGMDNAGNESVGLGVFAVRNNTALRATGVGHGSLWNNTGVASIGIGWQAGMDNSGNYGIYIGNQAGSGNAENNVLIVENRPINANPLIKGYFPTGALVIGAPPSATADANIGPNRFTFYLDEEADKLMVRVKYADGTTIKEGEIALV